jgi:16S rRNA (cytosine1402-N4)-methyltransferase
MEHIPVLLDETLEALDPKPNENFVDCTFGRGGHARAILERTAPNGKLIGLDWDSESINSWKKGQGSDFGGRLALISADFANLEAVLPEIAQGADGILYDLGMSSWHIDESKKGFSFAKDEPLDMRFDSSRELTAREIINNWPYKDLERIFNEFGQEKQSRRIALAIEKTRNVLEVKTTGQLAAIIAKAVRGNAVAAEARIFQALRIAVNRELESIGSGLDQGFKVLRSGGRMAVISFHSLEDAIVKNKFREWIAAGQADYINEKPIAPDAAQIASNPRSRSAKLRSIVKK